MGLKERLGVLKVLKETPLQVIVGSDFMPLCDYLSSLSERGREIKKRRNVWPGSEANLCAHICISKSRQSLRSCILIDKTI